MMRRASSIPLLALGGFLLLGAGCGPKDDSSGARPEDVPQGAEGFFAPRTGETWKYRVQREIPLDVELSEEDLARRPERNDAAHVITFERVRTCAGAAPLGGLAHPVTTMELFEDGVLLGEEIYDIGSEGVFFRGWIPAEESSAEDLLTEGVKLATPTMQAGESWTGTGADQDRQFRFRVIERAEVTVPAGTFEAARIQITSEHEGRGLKRTIWFADNIGIVKEESVYYGPRRTRVREHAELVHFVVPTQAPPPREALVTDPGDGEAAPANPDAPDQTVRSDHETAPATEPPADETDETDPGEPDPPDDAADPDSAPGAS